MLDDLSEKGFWAGILFGLQIYFRKQIIDFVINMSLMVGRFFFTGGKMEISKGVSIDFKEGKLMLVVDAKSLVEPMIDDLKAKVESGEVDVIKGTDLDKAAIVTALEIIKGYLK